MTSKLLLLIGASIGIAPAVLWSAVSLVTAAFSVFVRPVSFSFRLYSKTGSDIGALDYHALPVLSSLSILAGAALLLFGIASASRSH